MNIQQFIKILWFRKKIAFAVLLGVVTLTTLINLYLPKQYTATTTIVIDQNTVDFLTGLALSSSQILPGYTATQVEVVGSHNVALKVVENLKLDKNNRFINAFTDNGSPGNILDWIAKNIRKKLDIKLSRESNLIDISFTDIDPEFAAMAANAFADAYLLTSVELRTQPAKLNAAWFNTQMHSLRQELEKAQLRLSSFQQKVGIVETDDKLDVENARMAELSRQLLESQARTDELLSRKKMLTATVRNAGSSESMQEVMNSSLIQSLKTELAGREANLAVLSKRLDKNHPLYNQAQAEVNSLQQKISNEIRTVQNSINNELASSRQRDEILEKAFTEQKNKVLKLKIQHDEIAVLNNEVENARHSFDAAMQRSIQTRMESELNHANIAVLNKAIPPDKPSKPKFLLNLLLSFFLGSLLGVGGALIAELLDRRIHSKDDIKEYLGLPVFAVLVKPTGSTK